MKGIATRAAHNPRQTSPLFCNSSPWKTFPQPHHRHGNEDGQQLQALHNKQINPIRYDIRIYLKLLKKAKEGISINLLTFREPTRGCWTDACKYGLGGFNATGRAWSVILPEHPLHRARINLLKFLAELVAVQTDILKEDLDPFECFLSGSDSSTAIRWIHPTRAKPDNI